MENQIRRSRRERKKQKRKRFFIRLVKNINIGLLVLLMIFSLNVVNKRIVELNFTDNPVMFSLDKTAKELNLLGEEYKLNFDLDIDFKYYINHYLTIARQYIEDIKIFLKDQLSGLLVLHNLKFLL